MTATIVAGAVRYAVLPWLFLLFAVIVLKMLRGKINTVGLLRSSSDAPVDPERVGILATSMFAIGAYALNVLETGPILEPSTHILHMPDAPLSLLMILAGGNGIYLGGKFLRLRS